MIYSHVHIVAFTFQVLKVFIGIPMSCLQLQPSMLITQLSCNEMVFMRSWYAVGEGSNVVNPRKMYVHYEDQSEIECESQVRNEAMEKIIPCYIPGQRNCLETESTGPGK